MPGIRRAPAASPVPTKYFDTPQPFELLESFDQHHVHRPQLAQQHLQAGRFGRGGDARPARVRRDDDFGGARRCGVGGCPCPAASSSMSWWCVCLMVETLRPRALSAGISRSISVVLPLPWRPTMATTRISASSSRLAPSSLPTRPGRDARRRRRSTPCAGRRATRRGR